MGLGDDMVEAQAILEERERCLLACRAAYKKGLIDAAQVVCRYCRRSKPTVLPGVISHVGLLCNAVGIIEILEMAGGWQAEWPDPDHESTKR